MSKLTDLAALAAAVPDGATVAVGGFQLSRVPVALLRALAARGARELQAVSAPNPLGLDLLAAAGALRAADCAFIGLQYEDGFVTAPALSRAVAAGVLTLRQRDVYETLTELRDAARNGHALADFALLHAQRGDSAGNLAIDDPYADAVLAAGSRQVLATVEQIVAHVEAPTVAAARVAAVAHAPGGAAPAACFGHYRRDVGGVRAWLGELAPAGAASDASPERGDGGPGAGPIGRTHPADAFVINLARQVHDGDVVVTGLASAVAMLAIGVAQRTHAPNARYINCIGAVNPRLDRAWPTSVEPELLADCADTIDLPDLFELARAGGVDAMFFGAGQIDAAGNINLNRIGPEDAPAVRLPGPAGSPSMRSWVRRVLVAVPRQSARNLVARVDVVTSAPSSRNEQTVLVTDHAVWTLRDGRLAPDGLAPGLEMPRLAAATGFALGGAHPGTIPPPTETELAALREIDREGVRHRLLPGLRRLQAPAPDRPIHRTGPDDRHTEDETTPTSKVLS
jgi:acyl CoA:acetate/3-ketoacid CoA transferase alpha subunit/acyl CoA:acetate/3-ketoacid CoA transferase beta subunit